MSVRIGARTTCLADMARGAARGAALAIVVFVLCAAVARAQDTLRYRVLAGVRGGYELGYELGRFPVFAGSSDCGEFATGSVTGASGGAGISFGSLFSNRLGLALAVGVGSESVRFTAVPLEPLVILDTTGDVPVSPSIGHEYRYNASWRMARLDLLCDIRLADRLSVRVGPWLGYRYGAALNQTEDIINEPVYRFALGATERAMPGGEQITANAFAAGLAGSIAWQIPFTGRIWLVPELTVRGELTSAASPVAWHPVSAAIGLGVMYDATPAPPQPEPPRPPVADVPPRPTKIHASLALYGVDDAGTRLPSATIHIHEVLYRQRAPLLGPIYFGAGSAELPARYVRYTPGSVGQFAIDSLAGLGPLALHYQSLNLLGLRLRDQPAATITLTGFASQGEPLSLARERALTVRRYLNSVWAMDTARAQIAARRGSAAGRRTGEDSRGEQRMVVIGSASPAVIDPIVLDRMARDFDPPLIALDPAFDTAGLKDWTITLTYDGKDVGRYSSRDTGGASRSSIHWQIPDNQADLTHSFLAAELTVRDSSGSEATAGTQTPLTLERTFRIVDRVNQENNSEMVTYSLLAFGFNSAGIDSRNESVLDEIAESTQGGAHVSVVGYTDRTGTDGANRKLALERADAVAQALRAMLRERGVRNVTIATEGAGTDQSRFNNDVPEGRQLSRDVDVIVQQRVQDSAAGR